MLCAALAGLSFSSPLLCPTAHSVRCAAQLNWLGGATSLSPEAALARKREESLIEWLQENGVYLSPQSTWGRAGHPLRVESDTVDDFEPSGRGLIARRPIIQNEPLLEIPTKLVMTKEKAKHILGERVVPEEMGEYIALALLLLHERSRGGDSFFAPYIGVLPDVEEVGPSYAWQEDELALLQGSGALIATRSFQEKLRKEYAAVQESTLSRHPDLFPPDSTTFEDFRWAMAMLFSRGVDLRDEDAGTGQLGLVPYADLLNHSPYSSSNFNLNSIPFSKDKEVVLYADRPYAVNDQVGGAHARPLLLALCLTLVIRCPCAQVLITYGQKSNAALLLLYGFVIDRNRFDEVELRVSLAEDDPRYDEKVEFLRSVGLTPTQAFPLLIDRYSNELVQFLRLCCATLADGPLGSLRFNDPISVSNEVAVFEALREGCNLALEQYPETEEEDAKLMENSQMFAVLSRRQRMAVKLRRNEKRILKRTIRVCDSEIAELEAATRR